MSMGEAKRERSREGANEAAMTSTWLVWAMTTSSSGESDNDDHNIGIRKERDKEGFNKIWNMLILYVFNACEASRN